MSVAYICTRSYGKARLLNSLRRKAAEAEIDVIATEVLIRATRRSQKNCIIPDIILCPFSNYCSARVVAFFCFTTGFIRAGINRKRQCQSQLNRKCVTEMVSADALWKFFCFCVALDYFQTGAFIGL